MLTLSKVRNALKREELKMIFGGGFGDCTTTGCNDYKICCGPPGGPYFCQGCSCGYNCDGNQQ